MTTVETTASSRSAFTGVAFAGLFIGGLILSNVLGTATFPSPTDPDAVTEAYFAANRSATLGQGILQALSALPLAAFAMAAGRGMLARTAGVLAAATMAASGLITLFISVMGATGDTLHTLHYLTFMAGGLLHVPLLGIFVGASTAALARSVPRWLTVLGYVSAGLSVLSLISFVTESAMILLPLGRFTAIIWIVITALRK